ncbi:uncharacterized protein LMH87_008482 [Akanthomyces muscarius]|uniref:Cytochrome b2 n=1 Tax=Akanthomyces muscarius TaxID=2231603 RepID=A0A9W8UPT2_AKAMU|nr:uncharacterized protein LMH87_008482 [Akanthomyces muscarius]KAJ4157927.1 hypothetical protein LMH87_008482 [Akanthomyces muscarius]
MSKQILVSELRRHSSSDSCWIVVDGQVYDMTSFAPNHPGGAQIIYRYAGKDASKQYNAVHAPSLISQTLDREQHIGKLDESSTPAAWGNGTSEGSACDSAHSKAPLSRIINLHDFEASAKRSFSKKAWARYGFDPLSCKTLRMFIQLYVNKDRLKTEQLLQLLQNSGKITAIFVTVDLPVVSKREEDERADQGPIDGLGVPDKKGAGLARQSSAFIDPQLSWQDIPWIQKFTDLPIIVKGIQRWEDAQMAIRYGCNGIVVSNHGGRAADTAQPAIISLLELHKNLPEAFDKLTILVDGGFRRGSDVVKAICLGASAVGLGRPFMYSVNYGEEGVVHVTNVLREEIETAMRLCGMTDLMSDASPRYLNTKLVDGYVADRKHEYLREPSKRLSKI